MISKKGIAGIFLLACLFCISCNNKQEKKAALRYADLHDFFAREVEKLTLKGTLEHKFIRRGSSREENHSTPQHLKQELEIFADCDLNKPAWAESYSVDSVQKKMNTVVTYTCLDKLPVRKMRLVYDLTGLTSVYIEKNSENLIYRNVQKLLYNTAKGYAVYGEEKVLLFNPSFYHIRVTYSN